jgi:hypothetical protein
MAARPGIVFSMRGRNRRAPSRPSSEQLNQSHARSVLCSGPTTRRQRDRSLERGDHGADCKPNNDGPKSDPEYNVAKPKPTRSSASGCIGGLLLIVVAPRDVVHECESNAYEKPAPSSTWGCRSGSRSPGNYLRFGAFAALSARGRSLGRPWAAMSGLGRADGGGLGEIEAGIQFVSVEYFPSLPAPVRFWLSCLDGRYQHRRRRSIAQRSIRVGKKCDRQSPGNGHLRGLLRVRDGSLVGAIGTGRLVAGLALAGADDPCAASGLLGRAGPAREARTGGLAIRLPAHYAGCGPNRLLGVSGSGTISA